ncbi:MAG: sigma factor [Rhodomicrobium sp.]
MTTTGAIETVWRIEQPKLAARLVRYLRDVGLAEEIAQDAFVLALERWPRDGIPRNPAAWLTQVAKNRALDRLRRTTLIDGKHRELAIDVAELERETPDIEGALDKDIDDDLLRLIFTACHPVLPAEQRAALALRLLGGLTTPEIARPSSCPKPPSPSASCVPSGLFAMPPYLSRRRAGKSGVNASLQYWRWSI